MLSVYCQRRIGMPMQREGLPTKAPMLLLLQQLTPWASPVYDFDRGGEGLRKGLPLPCPCSAFAALRPRCPLLVYVDISPLHVLVALRAAPLARLRVPWVSGLKFATTIDP